MPVSPAPVIVLIVVAIAPGTQVSVPAALGIVLVGGGIVLVRESRMAAGPWNLVLAVGRRVPSAPRRCSRRADLGGVRGVLRLG